VSARVTVVIPLYNKALTIERALISVARQTYSEIEIIVVDDGSTDSGGIRAENFRDERLRVIRQMNHGPGSARNRGVADSSSELIAFLDADDEWEPEFLRRSLTLLDQADSRVAAVVTGFREGSARQSTEGRWRARGLQPGLVRLTPQTPAEFVITLLAYMNPWAMVVRRGAILRYGGFYEAACRYGEDNYLWLKLILSEGIVLTLEPLVCWHSEESGLSRNLGGPRPVEPFFTDPAGLFDACPPAMRQLLHDVLAIRAGKTASMLSFWGRWREGRRLLNEFCTLRDLRYFWVRIGQISSTPLGAGVGWVIRQAMFFEPRVTHWLPFTRSR
jgi:glycosyltransferase involved in cell wall biosynthesis